MSVIVPRIGLVWEVGLSVIENFLREAWSIVSKVPQLVEVRRNKVGQNPGLSFVGAFQRREVGDGRLLPLHGALPHLLMYCLTMRYEGCPVLGVPLSFIACASLVSKYSPCICVSQYATIW